MKEENIEAIVLGLMDGILRNNEMAQKEVLKGNWSLAQYHDGIAQGYTVVIQTLEHYKQKEREEEGGE